MSENCAKVIRIITLPQVLVFFLILLLGDQIPPWHHEMAIVLLCVVPLISYLYWHTDVVEVLTGQEITVQFDRPAPLQNDGETIPDVTTYRASACAEVLAER